MTKSKAVTLKPGLLVSLRTTINGGIQYVRRELEHETDGGTDRSKWETERIITDVQEWDEAKKARGDAGALIRKVCVPSAFGLLCPIDKRDELDGAIEQATLLAEDHNATHNLTTVRVYVLKGEIASSDEEAVRAISSEVSDLLADMEQGIRNVDVQTVRKAASDAKKLGGILDETANAKVQTAVKAARSAARQIVKRIEKDGEDAIDEIVQLNMGAISGARMAFLEFGEDDDHSGDAMPLVDPKRSGALDIESEVA